ncbi:glycosyltransferase involved in cell wall biosynthesis [Winogradskyella epiphytica]|uniref:Glycosyltransferase involved in cell wall biosynthesis n=1 Tax=Winogradskyella epiphytica TaxID=262005 RepID=A0A2V4WY09_9FLAO|nr:glycosyltransferase [Winogradskyella epiphytica]PYE82136.1 glycosyltransferase involved in cell wall biosynthesis [Winogradskyella epiphytica]GGW60299.1 glycosyl transferase family 1 [Winogradskyella epiphytica]
MIKILFTIPNFDTAGSGRALLQVAKRLDPKRFEVHIACMHNRGTFFKTVEESGIPIHIIQYTTPMKPYLKGIKACYDISRKLKAIAPDIIHSMHYAADYSEPLAAKMAGITWVYTKKNMNWGGASKNAWLVRTFLASAIAVQNTDMLQEFFKNSKKTTLIPRGVDVAVFKPVIRNEDLVKHWQLDSKQRIVMCVANLVPVKGIEVLLQAFQLVCEQLDDWILMLVGDATSDYGLEMIKLTQTLGLKNRVLFCGKQGRIQDYLSLAELFVLPTLGSGEGSPVSLLEAMAAGKNVLGAAVSGIKDQLQPFPEHLVVAGNVASWGKALLACCSKTRAENIQIGNRFRDYVVQNYHIDKEVATCQELYLKLTN